MKLSRYTYTAFYGLFTNLNIFFLSQELHGFSQVLQGGCHTLYSGSHIQPIPVGGPVRTGQDRVSFYAR